MKILHIVPLLLLVLFYGCAEIPVVPKIPQSLAEVPSFQGKFTASTQCRNCHTKLWDQQSQSMHAKSYENPVFQAHYFSNILFRAREGGRLYEEARSCAPCHMPVAYMENGGQLVMRGDVDQARSGVTCDLCHRISGYEGKNPGNGNYKARPGQQKFGPFRYATGWHHRYLKLQTQSEFCAICHNAFNTLGVEVKSTYTEWLASPHAESGVECQDCHMSQHGYQVDGDSEYESGKAARMTLGKAPHRDKLYSHRFPGGRTKTQLADTLSLDILTDPTAAPGDKTTISVIVENTHAGHKVPSGSIELRYIWLDVCVLSGDKRIDIPAVSLMKPGYDVSGEVDDDKAALGANFPDGKRMYRAIFIDQDGKRTHSLVDAAKKAFDNRLEPAILQKELYQWRIPEDASGKIIIKATLNYVAYPLSFAKMLKIAPADTFPIAEAEGAITLNEVK